MAGKRKKKSPEEIRAARQRSEATQAELRRHIRRIRAELAAKRSSRSSSEPVVSEVLDRYLILIEGGPPGSYSAWSPDVPGCAAVGETVDEAERQMRAAIALHLEGLVADGDPIPQPSGPGVYVKRTPRAAA